MRDLDDLMDELVGELRPVRPLSRGKGRALAAATALATCAAVLLLLGVRPDIAAGEPAPLVLLIAGLFMIVAAAATWAVTRAAQPAVGAVQGNIRWAVAALLLLPAVALISTVIRPSLAPGLDPAAGLSCLLTGLVSSLASAVTLTWWLRRGAPANPERAGWLIGLASGAIGGLAITLECPHDALTHLGFWHVAVAAAVMGRAVIAPLIRW